MDNLSGRTAGHDGQHHGSEQWKATRLIDERTGNSYIGFDFPRRHLELGFEVFDDDLAENPKRVRTLLKTRGAAFTGTRVEQIQFIRELLKGMPPEPMILAMKPGLRGRDGFVLGKRMLGTAKGRFRWRSQLEITGQREIGDRNGALDDWNQDVGAIALHSTLLTFGLCVPLACPLPSYVLAHGQKRLLPGEAAATVFIEGRYFHE